MIRRLCRALGAEPVFLELALELSEERDLAFAATMVQVSRCVGPWGWVWTEERDHAASATKVVQVSQSVRFWAWVWRDECGVAACAVGTRNALPAPAWGSRRRPTAAAVYTSACHLALVLLRPPAPQALNLILLTSPEVRDLREALAGAAAPDARPAAHAAGAAVGGGTTSGGAALFAALYPCWSHSVGALLSLCFLAQVRAWLGLARRRSRCSAALRERPPGGCAGERGRRGQLVTWTWAWN